MAGSSSSSSAYVLNQDLEIETLSRLSVKSLLRLRCVCKSWCALIKSRDFITRHLQNNRKSLECGNAPLFLTDNQHCKPFLSWISSNINNDEATVVEVPSSVYKDSLPFSDGKVIPRTILGPVNGIYLAVIHAPGYKDINPAYGNDQLFLCNPSLREVKALHMGPRFFHYATYGLGYDFKANDFKVVAITESDGAYHNSPPSCTLVFVYALSSNSWRQIEYDVKSMPASPWCPRNAFFVSHSDCGGGVVHWISLNTEEQIISFDFGNEAFRLSKLPDIGISKRTKSGRFFLAILNESIHIIFPKHPCENYFELICSSMSPVSPGVCSEVWKLKEFGVKESWTKLYDTERIPLAHLPLGFWQKNREILFLTMSEYDQVVSYDPICNKSNTFDIGALQACTYMESLVSINGGAS